MLTGKTGSLSLCSPSTPESPASSGGFRMRQLRQLLVVPFSENKGPFPNMFDKLFRSFERVVICENDFYLEFKWLRDYS